MSTVEISAFDFEESKQHYIVLETIHGIIIPAGSNIKIDGKKWRVTGVRTVL